MKDRRPEPFKALDQRLDQARQTQKEKSRKKSGGEGASRIAIEMVVAVLFGTGVGYLIDDWLGTLPLFMLIFMFLGMGAGVLNVYRAGIKMAKTDHLNKDD